MPDNDGQMISAAKASAELMRADLEAFPEWLKPPEPTATTTEGPRFTPADSAAWRLKKSEGDEAERLIAERFRNVGYNVTKDLESGAIDLHVHADIEVKRDRIAHRTGNLAVEVTQKGRASGIAVTGAHFWAFVVDKGDNKGARGLECLLITTVELKAILREMHREKIPPKSMGDGKTGYLVPRKRVEALARILQLPTAGSNR